MVCLKANLVGMGGGFYMSTHSQYFFLCRRLVISISASNSLIYFSPLSSMLHSLCNHFDNKYEYEGIPNCTI